MLKNLGFTSPRVMTIIDRPPSTLRGRVYVVIYAVIYVIR